MIKVFTNKPTVRSMYSAMITKLNRDFPDTDILNRIKNDFEVHKKVRAATYQAMLSYVCKERVYENEGLLFFRRDDQEVKLNIPNRSSPHNIYFQLRVGAHSSHYINPREVVWLLNRGYWAQGELTLINNDPYDFRFENIKETPKKQKTKSDTTDIELCKELVAFLPNPVDQSPNNQPVLYEKSIRSSNAALADLEREVEQLKEELNEIVNLDLRNFDGSKGDLNILMQNKINKLERVQKEIDDLEQVELFYELKKKAMEMLNK